MSEEQPGYRQTTLRGWLPTWAAVIVIVVVTPTSWWLLHHDYGAIAVSLAAGMGYLAGSAKEMLRA